MARRKKNISLQEQIDEVLKDIEKLKDELSEKKALVKELEARKNDESLSQIVDALRDSGKSIEDVMEFLSRPRSESANEVPVEKPAEAPTGLSAESPSQAMPEAAPVTGAF